MTFDTGTSLYSYSNIGLDGTENHVFVYFCSFILLENVVLNI